MNENVLKEEIAMLENQIRILQQQNQELKIQVSAREEVYNKYKEAIDKAIEYLEQPYRDNFDYSKTQILEILKEVE